MPASDRVQRGRVELNPDDFSSMDGCWSTHCRLSLCKICGAVHSISGHFFRSYSRKECVETLFKERVSTEGADCRCVGDAMSAGASLIFSSRCGSKRSGVNCVGRSKPPAHHSASHLCGGPALCRLWAVRVQTTASEVFNNFGPGPMDGILQFSSI